MTPLIVGDDIHMRWQLVYCSNSSISYTQMYGLTGYLFRFEQAGVFCHARRARTLEEIADHESTSDLDQRMIVSPHNTGILIRRECFVVSSAYGVLV